MNAQTERAKRQNHRSWSEVQLVEALCNHEESAFSELVDQYQTTMVRLALRYVDNVETAKEVVQETWLAVLRGIHRFEGRASFKTWLFTILVNRARTRRKRTKQFFSLNEWAWEQLTDQENHPWTENDSGGEGPILASPLVNAPEEQMIRQEVQACVQQAILTLPVTQRNVMVLRDVEGWTAEEICLALGLSDSNQRVLLHRARTKVRQALERYLKE